MSLPLGTWVGLWSDFVTFPGYMYLLFTISVPICSLYAFNHGLHCFLRQNRSSEKETQYLLFVVFFFFFFFLFFLGGEGGRQEDYNMCRLDVSDLYRRVATGRPGSLGFNAIWASMRETLTVMLANNKGADQPAHPRSLISAFVIRYLKCKVSRSDFS